MKARRSAARAGFSLVEVALALGIAAFCLVALLGMIPVGLNSSQNAVSQTGAASLLTAVGADLRDTALPTSTVPNPTSPFFQIPVPTPAPSPAPSPAAPTVFYVDEGGSFNTSLGALPTARYRVTVTNLPSPTPAPSPYTPIYATSEQVVITWPPQASVKNAAGSMAGIIELNRN